MGILALIFAPHKDTRCFDSLETVKHARRNQENAVKKLDAVLQNRLGNTIGDMLTQQDDIKRRKKNAKR